MTTTTVRWPSTSHLRRHLATRLRHLATGLRYLGAQWRAARVRLHLPRRCTVTAIQCTRCRTWVNPRRYSVRYMACPPCTRTLAHTARTRLRTQRAHHHP